MPFIPIKIPVCMLYMKCIRTSLFLAMALLTTFPLSIKAAPDWNFEKLLMPGELIEGHAEYEADCTNCQDRKSVV